MSVRRLAVGLVPLLLAACASAPGIPDTRYFRLPERVAATPLAQPALADPLVVETFYADGVHSDQALLYSSDPDGEQLRAYHYQLWVDPPTRMLQRRLIRTLDEARLAPLVTERLPPHGRQYRLQARIESFERLQRADGWHVRAALAVRLDHSESAQPLLARSYVQERRAGGEGIRDTVRALGTAVDALYADLLRDLSAPNLAAAAR